MGKKVLSLIVFFSLLILLLPQTVIFSAASESPSYAVILYSDYDAGTGVVTVKLSFTDDTVGTYQVSKLADDLITDNSIKTQFANNMQTGAVVSVDIENGLADLSSNSTESWSENTGYGGRRIREQLMPGMEPSNSHARAYVSDAKFYFNNQAYYPSTDNGIVFMIYGGTDINGDGSAYSSLQAKAFHISNIRNDIGQSNPVYAKIGVETTEADAFNQYYLGDVIWKEEYNGLSSIVAGSMSVGAAAYGGNPNYGNPAYILNATYNYNENTGKWYLDVDMVDKDGLISTRTVDEAYNGTDLWIPATQGVGDVAIPAGSLVLYDTVYGEDEILYLETIGGAGIVSNMVKSGEDIDSSSAQNSTGYYAVQLAKAENGSVGFFANSHFQDSSTSSENWDDDMILLDTDSVNYEEVAIYDNSFVSIAEPETVSHSDRFESGYYNAIIAVKDGKVYRVFSLLENAPVNAGSGKCGNNLTWVLDFSAVLTISGTGEMYNYTEASPSPWSSFNSDIKSVVIGSGVKSIGANAFFNCYELKNISLPEGLTSIGTCAFYSCNGLTNAILPESLISIGNGAFSGCWELTDIIIPKGITKIEASTFSDCRKLTEAVLPYGVLSIGNSAFLDCIKLTEIKIPASVTDIGSAAFYNCKSLVSVTIPEGVSAIKDTTFYRCTSLESATVPASVTSVGESAFYGCNNLVVYGYGGSYLEEYCKENSVNFTDINANATDIFGTQYAYIRQMMNDGVSEYHLSLIAGINSTEYSAVGFEYRFADSQTVTGDKIVNVYKSITHGNTAIDNSKLGIDDAGYLFYDTFSFPVSQCTDSIMFRAYAIDAQGNYLYGAWKTIRTVAAIQ